MIAGRVRCGLKSDDRAASKGIFAVAGILNQELEESAYVCSLDT